MVAFGALSGGVGAELSGGNFWQGAVTGGIVAGLNHVMHSGKTELSVDRDEDCLTCPKNAVDGQIYSSVIDGSNLQYRNGNWVEVPSNTIFKYNGKSYFARSPIGGDVPLGLGASAKGLKWLSKYASKGAKVSVVKIGEYYKYTAKVLAKNGNGSYTIHTKYLNSYGKTIRYFHDTYNSTGKFIHRGWTEGSTKVHLWWNGVKQYGEHFFQNR